MIIESPFIKNQHNLINCNTFYFNYVISLSSEAAPSPSSYHVVQLLITSSLTSDTLLSTTTEFAILTCTKFSQDGRIVYISTSTISHLQIGSLTVRCLKPILTQFRRINLASLILSNSNWLSADKTLDYSLVPKHIDISNHILK
jgi:hypothetical protein